MLMEGQSFEGLEALKYMICTKFSKRLESRTLELERDFGSDLRWF